MINKLIPKQTANIARVSQTLYAGFRTVPMAEHLYRKLNNLPLNSKLDVEAYKKSYEGYTKHYLDMGGFVSEVNDYDAVSLWSRPGNVDEFDFNTVEDKKFVKEYFGRVEQLKKKFLGDLPAYHLFMIAKDLERQTKGSVRGIFEHYTAMADREGAAIYLEAVTHKAASVYEHFGFKHVGNITFGKGEVDPHCLPDPNGEGFTAYFMIYYKGKLPVKEAV